LYKILIMVNLIAEPVTLLVQKDKLKAFLEMLKLFDFVKVQTLDEQIEKYIQNSPQNVPFSEDDIMNFVKQNRNQKVANA
jgi:hypothetical protein